MTSTHRPKFPLSRLSLLAALVYCGCASVDIVNYTDPQLFARNLFRIAREGKEQEWGTQLTAERRAMGSEYIEKHFRSWRPILLQLETSFGMPIDQVGFRLEGTGLEFEFDKKWHLLFRVSNDEEGIKINQD